MREIQGCCSMSEGVATAPVTATDEAGKMARYEERRDGLTRGRRALACGANRAELRHPDDEAQITPCLLLIVQPQHVYFRLHSTSHMLRPQLFTSMITCLDEDILKLSISRQFNISVSVPLLRHKT